MMFDRDDVCRQKLCELRNMSAEQADKWIFDKLMKKVWI